MKAEMKAKDLRQKFVDFFVSKDHAEIQSAPLVPENDPTCLFTTAGMHPLVPYLLGEKHPAGTRLVDYQKCVRTGDIEEVGDATHLTFFEMLGNWSLGDYFKKESIEFSFEFLTDEKWLNLPLNRLAFSVFEGDDDAPFDEEAFNYWKGLGVSEQRIAKLEKKHNWWGPAGQTGPCGPDTEIFFWNEEGDAPDEFDADDERWVEIWNNVFMQYYKNEDGTFSPLEQQNVDTGMGLERVTAILQKKESCYDTELFIPLFAKLDTIRGVETPETRTRSERIVVEHMRTATFMLMDGVVPGNTDQNYVLRRLIRRAIVQAHNVGVTTHFTTDIVKTVIEQYKDAYPAMDTNSEAILDEMDREEKQFQRTLEKGTKEFDKLISRVPEHVRKKVISGKNAFNLYETYGFPLEITEELAIERGFEVDKPGFEKAMKKHQELSRKGAEAKFKGGLADDSEATSALHTATHLLHKALRQVLGDHVCQKGSNITTDRLRFDFNNEEKMTKEQVTEVENIVNEQIQRKLSVTFDEMTVEEAKAQGAIGLFGDKYDERVRVYSVGDFSKEICGGPHAVNTADLGEFKIKKEQSSSRGIRRIKAVLK